MASRMKPAKGSMTLAEMKEFAAFPSSTQRYIRRSLDMGLDREDAMQRWSRDMVEAASIRAQARLYNDLPELRAMVPDDSGLDAIEPFLAPLMTLVGVRPGAGAADEFLGVAVPVRAVDRRGGSAVVAGAFCAAAALPHLHPELRRKLLQSISEAAATASGWSNRQPAFFPYWVEKVDTGRPCRD